VGPRAVLYAVVKRKNPIPRHIMYLHNKFHTCGYNGKLITAFNNKSRYRFRAAAMLYFTIYKKRLYHKLNIFRIAIRPTTHSHDNIFCVAPISDVCMLLFIVGN